MKKTISVILGCILIALSFCSCSGPRKALTEENVTKTVEAAFEALAEFDSKELDKYVDSKTLDVIASYAEKHTQFQELGKAIFSNLTYEIKEIDLENKTVTLSVQNKSLYDAASEFTQELLKQFSTLELLRQLNNETWLDENLAALMEKIEASPMLSQPAEITLNITEGKKNLVLSFDDDAENGVSGGALLAIKKVISLS